MEGKERPASYPKPPGRLPAGAAARARAGGRGCNERRPGSFREAGVSPGSRAVRARGVPGGYLVNVEDFLLAHLDAPFTLS